MSRVVSVSPRVSAVARRAAPRLVPMRTAGGGARAAAAVRSARLPVAPRRSRVNRAVTQPTTTRCSANADEEEIIKLEPRHQMRIFIKKTGAKPVDDDCEPEPPIRYTSDTPVYAFESVDVSRDRRRWLTQTPFLTVQLGGQHAVKVVLFVADASVRADGLCKEADAWLSGIDYTMVTVYAEELYFVVHKLDADVMLVSDLDVRLARLSANRD